MIGWLSLVMGPLCRHLNSRLESRKGLVAGQRAAPPNLTGPYKPSADRIYDADAGVSRGLAYLMKNRELEVVSEFVKELDHGKVVAPGKYTKRFPQLTQGELRDALAALEVILARFDRKSEAYKARWNAERDRVLQYVRSHPDCSIQDVERALNLGRLVSKWTIARLEYDGELETNAEKLPSRIRVSSSEIDEDRR